MKLAVLQVPTFKYFDSYVITMAQVTVSKQVKAELSYIKETEGHLTIDGTIRARFTIVDLAHMDDVRNKNSTSDRVSV